MHRKGNSHSDKRNGRKEEGLLGSQFKGTVNHSGRHGGRNMR